MKYSTFSIIGSGLLLLSSFSATAEAAFRNIDASKPARGNYESSSKTPAQRGSRISQPEEVRMRSATSKHGFTVSYPSTWTMRDRPAYLELQFDESAIPEQLRSYIGITAKKMTVPSGLTEDRLHTWFMGRVTLSAQERESDWYVPSFALVESGSSVLLGGDALRYVYTGESRSEPFKAMQYIRLIDGMLYRVSFASSVEQFDVHIAEAEAIIASLKFDSAPEKDETEKEASSINDDAPQSVPATVRVRDRSPGAKDMSPRIQEMLERRRQRKLERLKRRHLLSGGEQQSALPGLTVE